MKIIEIIGQKIELIKYDSYFDKTNHLQCFEAYWKLTNGLITTLPTFPDFIIPNLDESTFRDALNFDETVINEIKGRIITDVYFSYFNGDLEDDERAFFELDNAIYVTQNSFAQDGVNHKANLRILSVEEFENLSVNKTEFKSIIEEI